jgi:hypothetical protein
MKKRVDRSIYQFFVLFFLMIVFLNPVSAVPFLSPSATATPLSSYNCGDKLVQSSEECDAGKRCNNGIIFLGGGVDSLDCSNNPNICTGSSPQSQPGCAVVEDPYSDCVRCVCNFIGFYGTKQSYCDANKQWKRALHTYWEFDDEQYVPGCKKFEKFIDYPPKLDLDKCEKCDENHNVVADHNALCERDNNPCSIDKCTFYTCQLSSYKPVNDPCVINGQSGTCQSNPSISVGATSCVLNYANPTSTITTASTMTPKSSVSTSSQTSSFSYKLYNTKSFINLIIIVIVIIAIIVFAVLYFFNRKKSSKNKKSSKKRK